jgi:hypothetical protein
MSQLDAMMAAGHMQIDTLRSARKAEAATTGRTGQDTIRGIFDQHRATVERTVAANVDSAERLRSDKVEAARQRNRADIRTVYHRARIKEDSYQGTVRDAHIVGAIFDVADGTAAKMREQEPDIERAVEEVTAPLPQSFRDQGAQALQGFDANLPQILASVGTGVGVTQANIDQRGDQAHQRLDEVGGQMRTEVRGLAETLIAQTTELGSQIEGQLDHALSSLVSSIALAAPGLMNRVSPPILEAITLFRTGERPDVEAAAALTAGLTGFLAEGVASSTEAMHHAAETGEQRFSQMRSGTGQAMHVQTARANQAWGEARSGTASAISAMLDNFDLGFGTSVRTLETTLAETQQTIRDELAPKVDQLDGSFRDTLSDAAGQIDSRIDAGLGKNTEAINELDGKMDEAADDAAYEWDHPVLHSVEHTLDFIAGLLEGILEVLAMVVALLIVTLIIAAVLGVSMLTAGLVLLAATAAFSIGYALGARLAAGQSFGEALGGAVTDYVRGVPHMLYEMSGIPKLRRAFSDEPMSSHERGKLLGEGGTEMVLAIFMVDEAGERMAGRFETLGPFNPPSVGVEPVAVPSTVVEPVTPVVVEPVSEPLPRVVAPEPVATPTAAPLEPGPAQLDATAPPSPVRGLPSDPQPQLSPPRGQLRSVPLEEPRPTPSVESVPSEAPRPPTQQPAPRPPLRGLPSEPGVQPTPPRPPELRVLQGGGEPAPTMEPVPQAQVQARPVVREATTGQPIEVRTESPAPVGEPAPQIRASADRGPGRGHGTSGEGPRTGRVSASEGEAPTGGGHSGRGGRGGGESPRDMERRREILEEFGERQERYGGNQEGQFDKVLDQPHPELSESTSPSQRLRAALEREGISVPEGHDAHHTVPSRGGGEAGDRARAVLDREDIDLDSEPNGVPLPRTTLDPNTVPEGLSRHQTIHTRLYYETLANRLEAAIPGTVRDVLRAIRIEILEGTFPH